MNKAVTLSDIAVGESCFVRELHTAGSMRRRLLDRGFTSNTKVTCLGRSPAGDPSAYLVCGAVIALRAADAEGIEVFYGA